METERAMVFRLNEVVEVVRLMGSTHHHFLRYFVIGCTASALDVLIFFVLYNELGTAALLAHSVSVPISVLFSFVVNARHNFKTRNYIFLRLSSFVVVCTIGYLAGYAMILTAEYLGFGANAGKIISLPVVFLIQYGLNSRITFRTGAGSAADSLG